MKNHSKTSHADPEAPGTSRSRLEHQMSQSAESQPYVSFHRNDVEKKTTGTQSQPKSNRLNDEESTEQPTEELDRPLESDPTETDGAKEASNRTFVLSELIPSVRIAASIPLDRGIPRIPDGKLTSEAVEGRKYALKLDMKRGPVPTIPPEALLTSRISPQSTRIDSGTDNPKYDLLKLQNPRAIGSVTSQLISKWLRDGTTDNMEIALERLERGSFNADVKNEAGLSLLQWAIQNDKPELVKQLIRLDADMKAKSPDGKSPMQLAAEYATESTMQMLIENGARVDEEDEERGGTVFHIALSRPPEIAANLVSVMMKQIPSSDAEDPVLKPNKVGKCFQSAYPTVHFQEGKIPFLIACEQGNLAACKELLQRCKKQQINATDPETGDSPLHIACSNRDMEMLRFLVEQAPEANVQNAEGKTPLHVVAKSGDEQLLRLLYKLKPDPNIGDKNDKTPVHIAAELGLTSVVEILADKFKASVLARTKDGSTLMHIAASFGHDETTLALLKRGVPLHMPNRNGALALHCAAKLGHVGVVRALLSKGAPIDFKTKKGYTALHVAVRAGRPEVVEYLLGYGADVQARGGYLNQTPLHCAANLSDSTAEACADMLIKSGADVNTVLENGETALHLACRVGNESMVQLLLEEKCDATTVSKEGETALHVAAQNRFCAVARMLIEFTGVPDRENAINLVRLQSKTGYTALHQVATIPPLDWKNEDDDVDITALLLDHNADISVVTFMTGENVLHCLARSGNYKIFACIVDKVGLGGMQVALNKQNKNGRSALLEACCNGHVKIVELLLQHNARIDVFDEAGKTSLHMAAESGHVELCDLLLRNRAFINSKTKVGYTPLHFAAKEGHKDVVELLLQKHKASVDATTMENQTPLHVAAETGQLSVCALLLEHGADPTARNNRGRTPLHVAAENNHPQIVHIFLRNKADPSALGATDINGLTCAHIAAMKGSLAVIRKLMVIDKDTVILAKTKDTGSTALHMAAAGGHEDVVRALLSGGANPLEENHEGMTALHVAAKKGWVHVLEAIDVAYWGRCSKKTGLNALHLAAYYGQREFAQAMLSSVSATSKSAAPSRANQFLDPELAFEHALTPLHMAAMSGDEGLVRMLLNITGVQVDVSSAIMNMTPLHLTAYSGHLAVAGQLLSRSTLQLRIKDSKGRTALQLAASRGHYDIVSLLVSQGSDVNVANQEGMTALHYATNAGHYKVVKFLIESGADPSSESIEGKIPMCLAAVNNHIECLRYLLQQKHNTYKLIKDKEFLFNMMVCGTKQDDIPLKEFILYSPAPVDTAINLSSFYRSFASKEKERTRDLNAIAELCEGIATELLSIAATEHNPAVILKSHNNSGQPFIDALIEHNQKIVVSHPSVQRYLTEVWNGGVNWGSWKLTLFFILVLICPPVWIFFSLPLFYRLNEAPVIKFSCHLVSHILFTWLLIVEVLRMDRPLYEISSPVPTPVEMLLLLWLSGKLVAELSRLSGFTSSFSSCITLLLSSWAMIIHIWAFLYPKLFMKDTEEAQKLVFTRTLLYTRNQLFAAVLLVSFVHYLEFLAVHHLFGPWAVIIRNLMYDLTRFLVILFLFMTGFAVHVTSVFQPAYEPPDVSIGLPTIAEIAEMMFFSLFGMVSVDGLPPLHLTPRLSHIMIKLIYAVYLIVTVIVLINLLIAMMSDTYQRIQAQSDIEWKFGRAKLIRQMNKKAAAPIPLNIFTKLYVTVKVALRHHCIFWSEKAQADFMMEENVDSYSALDMQPQDRQKKRKESSFVTLEVPKDERCLEEVINWKHVTQIYMKYQGILSHEPK